VTQPQEDVLGGKGVLCRDMNGGSLDWVESDLMALLAAHEATRPESLVPTPVTLDADEIRRLDRLTTMPASEPPSSTRPSLTT
jgi:hypothetical protein